MANVFKVSKQNMMLVLYVGYYSQIMFSLCAHGLHKRRCTAVDTTSSCCIVTEIFYKQHRDLECRDRDV